MSARELFHWSLYLNLCSEGSILMLKKQDLGINPHVTKNGSRDQSLTGIGGPRVTLGYLQDVSCLLNGPLFTRSIKAKYLLNSSVYVCKIVSIKFPNYPWQHFTDIFVWRGQFIDGRYRATWDHQGSYWLHISSFWCLSTILMWQKRVCFMSRGKMKTLRRWDWD